jgi:hypothetical protein
MNKGYALGAPDPMSIRPAMASRETAAFTNPSSMDPNCPAMPHMQLNKKGWTGERGTSKPQNGIHQRLANERPREDPRSAHINDSQTLAVCYTKKYDLSEKSAF